MQKEATESEYVTLGELFPQVQALRAQLGLPGYTRVHTLCTHLKRRKVPYRVYGKAQRFKLYERQAALRACTELQHTKEPVHRMPYVLTHGKIEAHTDEKKRYIRLGSEIAIVAKSKKGRWQLTSFFDENKEGRRDDMYISSTTEEERNAGK